MHGKTAIEDHFVTPALEDLFATACEDLAEGARWMDSGPSGEGERTKIGRDNAARLLGL